MSESAAEVAQELAAFLNDALATTSYARMGLMREHASLAELPIDPENPDPTIHLVAELKDGFAPYSRWTLSQAREQLAEGGPVEQRLGQQWIVYTFTAWEHEFRPRLERARGLGANALKVPLFGDLRRLRMDVVHHHGIATQRHSGKCEVLRHWVTVSAPITLTPERCEEFWRLVPWSDLERPAI